MQVDLLLRVGLLALRRMGLPRYRTKFSKHTFTQHQHLLALALKELKKTSYRGLVDELADSKAVDAHLHLRRIPHYTTPQKFLARTQPKWLNLLLKRLVQLVTDELYAALDATCWRERAANTHYLNRLGQRLETRDTWKSSDLFDVPTGLFVTTRGKAGHRMEGGDLIALVDDAEGVVEVYADAQYDTHRNWNGLKRRKIQPFINHKMGKSTPGQTIRGERKAAFLRKQHDPDDWKSHYRHRTRIEGAYHAMKALLGDHVPGHTRWMRERYRLTKYWAYDLQRVARRHARRLGLRSRRQGCLLNQAPAGLKYGKKPFSPEVCSDGWDGWYYMQPAAPQTSITTIQPAGPNRIESADDPISDKVVTFLMARRRETSDLDLKWTIDVARGSDFPKLAKDIFAFANHGGGHILFGFQENKDKGGFVLTGLPPQHHADQATLQEKFNAYSSTPITLHYREFEWTVKDEVKRFALLYVPPSPAVLSPRSEGVYEVAPGKPRVVFRVGQVFVRRGTQSIEATPDERKQVESRARDTNYAIGLISGTADRISETIYSDLFPFTAIPATVRRVHLTRDLRVPEELTSVQSSDWIYTLDDVGRASNWGTPRRPTVENVKTNDMIADPDGRRLFTRLLKEYAFAAARSQGMSLQEKGEKLYYPFEWTDKKRVVEWTGLTRKSTRQVAKRFTLPALEREVGVHVAAKIWVSRIGDAYFLRLLPSFVLTSDGKTPLVGEKEGAAITRLGSTKFNFNKSQLRSLLFWVHQFPTQGTELLLGPGLRVSSRPAEASLDYGIRSDIPTGFSALLEEDDVEPTGDDAAEAGSEFEAEDPV